MTGTSLEDNKRSFGLSCMYILW